MSAHELATGDGPVFARARRVVLIGTLLALASATLYGVNIPAARIASQAGFSGSDLITWRALITVPLLLIIALTTGTKLIAPPGQGGTLARLALAASFTATFYLSAIDHLPVPMAVVIFYTFPLAVMVISNRIEGRRLSGAQIGIFALAFTGLVLAVGPSFAGLSMKGILFAFAGAIACAFMFILAGRVEDAPLRNVFWTQVAMVFVAGAFTLLKGGMVPPAAFLAAPVAIFIAMAGYLLGYALQLMAAARISPARASLLFLFEPMVAIITALLVLGDTLTGVQASGLVLILMSLVAEVLSGIRLTPDPEPAP